MGRDSNGRGREREGEGLKERAFLPSHTHIQTEGKNRGEIALSVPVPCGERKGFVLFSFSSFVFVTMNAGNDLHSPFV